MSNTESAKPKRLQQYKETYRMAKRTDPLLGLWIVGSFLVGAAVGAGIFWFMPGSGILRLVLLVLSAILLGIIAALITFGRRAQSAMYQQMEGTLGAGAGALQMLSKGYKVTTAVAVTKQQDLVHRVVGRPGIVLVGEGNPNRVKGLLLSERKRHSRVLGDVPVHEIMVGNEEGLTPVPKLVKSVQGLPRAIEPADMTDILNRLKAMDSVRPIVPMPKGPVPTSMKGMRRGLRGR